jgi:uncharacterized protein
VETPFDQGFALFAAGRYFEAHEAWEHEWMRAPRSERFFLQALIHFAVALHHRGQGNAEGEARQWSKALRKLAGYLPRHRGVDTGALYREALAGPGAVVIRRITISQER